MFSIFNEVWQRSKSCTSIVNKYYYYYYYCNVLVSYYLSTMHSLICLSFHSPLTFSRLHEVYSSQVTDSSPRITRNPPCLLSTVPSLCFRLRNVPFSLQATSMWPHSVTCLFKHTVVSIKLWTAQRLWTWNSVIKYVVPTCLPVRSFRSVNKTFQLELCFSRKQWVVVSSGGSKEVARDAPLLLSAQILSFWCSFSKIVTNQ